MTSNPNSIAWPSETLLVQRAERSVNAARATAAPQIPAVSLIQSIEDMEARLRSLTHGPHDLVPPGFDSAGTLGPLKRFAKKVTRRLVWWYVEPRWTVQRQLTQELAAFAKASVQASLVISAELEILRSQVSDLQSESKARAR